MRRLTILLLAVLLVGLCLPTLGLYLKETDVLTWNGSAWARLTKGALSATCASGLAVGGGYGDTGLSISSAGALTSNSTGLFDSTITSGKSGSNGGLVVKATGGSTTFSVAGATGNTVVVGTLDTTGATTLTGATTVGGGYGATGATIGTDGAISTNGALIVDGASTLTGAVGIGTGYAGTGTTLGATGAISAKGALIVDGASTLTGAVAAGSTLGVTGATTLTGGVTVLNAPVGAITWPGFTGLTTGTDTTPVNGTRWYSSLFIPYNRTITGIGYLIGTVGGTDKVIVELKSSTGASLATSNTAGATVGTAATFQEVAFTGTYAAVGPAIYYVVVQMNGTTARLRTLPTATAPAYTNWASSTAGTFGTTAAITAPSTFTADKGPVAYIY
jgi:hypothetical protein